MFQNLRTQLRKNRRPNCRELESVDEVAMFRAALVELDADSLRNNYRVAESSWAAGEQEVFILFPPSCPPAMLREV